MKTYKTGSFDKDIKKEKFNFLDKDINEGNFPIQTTQTENWKLIRMEKYFILHEALDEIKKAGCRPANAYELLLWKKNHGNELKDYEHALALGQLFVDARGLHRVPLVGRDSDGDWGFGLVYFVGGWHDGRCLLCFCDSPLVLESLENPDSLTLSNFIKDIKEVITKYEQL